MRPHLKTLAKQANAGAVHYIEQQMNKIPRLLCNGAFGPIDVAVAEAIGITKKDHLIPSNSGGPMPNFLQAARKVIIEVNTAQPAELTGLHDLYLSDPPPRTTPIPLLHAGHRIGFPHVPLTRTRSSGLSPQMCLIRCRKTKARAPCAN